jgi:hypothetical protein
MRCLWIVKTTVEITGTHLNLVKQLLTGFDIPNTKNYSSANSINIKGPILLAVLWIRNYLWWIRYYLWWILIRIQFPSEFWIRVQFRIRPYALPTILKVFYGFLKHNFHRKC